MKFYKVRFTLLSISVILVYLFMVSKSLYQNFDDFKLGFTTGVEAGEADDNSSAANSIYYLTLKPKAGFQSFPDSVINLRNNSMVKYANVDIKVKTSFDETQLKEIQICEALELISAFLLLIIVVYLPFLFFKIIISLMKEVVFDKINIRRLRKMGIVLIVFTIVEYAFDSFSLIKNQKLFELSDYKIISNNEADVVWVLLGVLVLLFAEILSRGAKMKEEQDLTI